MKIYIITKGDYSDYHICAVTDDPKDAEALATLFSDRYDEARVEEYDTKTPARDLLSGRVPWVVHFDAAGNAEEVNNAADYCEGFTPGEIIFEATRWSGERVVVKLYAPNREAAIKIAAEKRAELLARRNDL